MTRKIRGVIKDSKYPPKDKYVLWLKESTLYQFKGDDWYPLSTNSDVLEIMEDFNARIEDFLRKIRRDTEEAKDLLEEAKDKNTVVEGVADTIENLINQVSTATRDAQSAVNNANNAAQTALTSINSLNTALTQANTATTNANNATDRANQAAQDANVVINRVNEKIANVNEDISNLNTDFTNLDNRVSDNTAMINTINDDLAHHAYVDTANTFSQPQTFSGNVFIAGDLILKGEVFEQDTEHIKTPDAYITLRDGAVVGLATGEYAGITVTKYNGVTDGVMQIGADGTMRIGDLNDTQPILTRAESNQFNDGDILSWSTSSLKAVPFNAAIIDMEVTYEDDTTEIFKIINKVV